MGCGRRSTCPITSRAAGGCRGDSTHPRASIELEGPLTCLVPRPPGAPALDRLKEPGTIDDVLRNIDQIIDWAIEATEPHRLLRRPATSGPLWRIRDAVNDGSVRRRAPHGAARRRLRRALLQRAERATSTRTSIQGLTLPWEVSFVGDQDRQAIILQHMMAGLNAHITFRPGSRPLGGCAVIRWTRWKTISTASTALLCYQIPGIARRRPAAFPENPLAPPC